MSNSGGEWSCNSEKRADTRQYNRQDGYTLSVRPSWVRRGTRTRQTTISSLLPKRTEPNGKPPYDGLGRRSRNGGDQLKEFYWNTRENHSGGSG